MPTASGQYEFQDFDHELVVRGFDMYQPIDRGKMINLGYREVARKFPWTCEETTATYSLTPGEFSITLGGGAPLGIDSVRNIRIATDPYRRHLTPEEEWRFKEKWLYLDLTIQQNQGQTAKYCVYQGKIYLLPPPQFAMDFTVDFYKFLPDMVNPTDTAVLPQVFDEILIDAALVRCHRRAHELDLAADCQARVQMAVDDMLRDDVWQMEELQERVHRDDQWW